MPEDRGTLRDYDRARGTVGHAVLFTLLVIGIGGPESRSDEPLEIGRRIYQQRCARCHGLDGEGVADVAPEPLQGGHALGDLLQIVEDTMPEDDPEACTGEEARQVARYIYEAFYVPRAQADQPPPRVELARMTVRQYEQSVADLLGTFLGEAVWDDRRGLNARYYDARGFRRDKLVSERVDAQVEFDFGQASPEPGTIDAEEFAIQWQGGVIATDTGDYEFCVATPNGVRLWVNDLREPLIDAWVVSGDQTEHRGTVRLLGGRVYPLRVEYAKSKEKSASIALRWHPPGGAESTIPAGNLWPQECPTVYVVKTPFPPDDGSVGYERGTRISPAWNEAKTQAAVEITSAIVTRLPALAGFKDEDPERPQRMKRFCRRFAERAFRRPLTDEEDEFFVEQHFRGVADPETAVKRSLLLTLLSPRFLYVDFAGRPASDHDVASRLAFALWDSLPDTELLQAAASGQLHTREQVVAQAHRMLAHPRARSKVRHFLHHWLNIVHVEVDDLSKDRERYGRFDEPLIANLRASLDLFLDRTVWSDSSDFRQLLLADYWYVNDQLADYYGLDVQPRGEDAPSDDFYPVTMDREQFAGILTHPFLLARLAYRQTSSPIHRGVFAVRSLLGRFLKPPPIAVAPAEFADRPELTTRQRVELQTSEPTCMTCHGMINALGFTFENYDAVGKYRTVDNHQPVDASGGYTSLSGEQVEFTGAREFAEFLAVSDETHRCFVQQLFHQVVKQPTAAYGPDTLESLRKSFAESDFNIQHLLVEIVTLSALGAD